MEFRVLNIVDSLTLDSSALFHAHHSGGLHSLDFHSTDITQKISSIMEEIQVSCRLFVLVKCCVMYSRPLNNFAAFVNILFLPVILYSLRDFRLFEVKKAHGFIF